jgi:hypothetical protein
MVLLRPRAMTMPSGCDFLVVSAAPPVPTEPAHDRLLALAPFRAAVAPRMDRVMKHRSPPMSSALTSCFGHRWGLLPQASRARRTSALDGAASRADERAGRRRECVSGAGGPRCSSPIASRPCHGDARLPVRMRDACMPRQRLSTADSDLNKLVQANIDDGPRRTRRRPSADRIPVLPDFVVVLAVVTTDGRQPRSRSRRRP